MTRWARGNKGNTKRPYEASSWDELKGKKSKTDKHPRKTKKDEEDPVKPKQQTLKTKKRKTKKRQEGDVKGDNQSIDETQSCVILDPLIMQEDGSSLKSSLSERLTLVTAPYKELTEVNETALELHYKMKDRRREERRLKRIKKKANKMVCFNCREAGHGVADCPKILSDVEQGTGICFRCGSTEHEASKCTARIDPGQGDFPFAKCYICQETGHLSRSCPDNPRGLYPLGGGCKHCGSVEHRNHNCPDVGDDAKETGDDTTVPTLASTLGWSADADYDDMKPKVSVPRPPVKKAPKVVRF